MVTVIIAHEILSCISVGDLVLRKYSSHYAPLNTRSIFDIQSGAREQISSKLTGAIATVKSGSSILGLTR